MKRKNYSVIPYWYGVPFTNSQVLNLNRYLIKFEKKYNQ